METLKERENGKVPLFIGQWPLEFLPYFVRDECQVLASKINDLLAGQSGSLVLYGTSGVGKTSAAVFILRNRIKNWHNVTHVVWLNVRHLKKVNSSFDDILFEEQILKLLKPPLLCHELLVVADDVFNIGVVRYLSKLGGPNLKVLALTDDRRKAFYENFRFRSESFEMPVMTEETVLKMLVGTFELGFENSRRLAGQCRGLPLFASLARFQVDTLSANVAENHLEPHYPQLALIDLLKSLPDFPALMDQLLLGFLVFEPNLPVSLTDLRILLNDHGKTAILCHKAVECSVLQPYHEDCYILHELLYEALTLFKQEKLKTDSTRNLKTFLVGNCMNNSSFNLIAEAVKHDRFPLLQHLIDYGDAERSLQFCQDEDFEVMKNLLVKCFQFEEALRLFCQLAELCLKGGISSKILVSKIGSISKKSPEFRGRNVFWHCAKFERGREIAKILASCTGPIDVNLQDETACSNTALHEAVIHGNFDFVEYLIDEQGALQSLKNRRNKANALELALAICQDRKDLGVWLLLRPSASMSAFWFENAFERGDDDVRQLLLRKKDSLLRKGRTLPDNEFLKFDELINACQSGDAEQLRKLLNEGCLHMIDRQSSTDGYTLLMTACHRGNLEVVRLLLNLGADVDLQGYDDGKSALFIATENLNLKMAELLLIHGADVDLAMRENWSPIHCASQHGDLNTLKLLLNHGANVSLEGSGKWTALHIASFEGEVSIIKLLIQNGALVNCKDANGDTPLYLACQNGKFESVELLLDHGASENASNSVLHMALACGHVEIANLLLDRGFDVNFRDPFGRTAMLAASERGQVDQVQILFGKGSDPALADVNGWTPLFAAVIRNHVEVAKLLIAHQKSFTRPIVDIQTNDGWTALHAAAQKGFVECCELLLNKGGANVNLAGNNGWTPLHVASQHNQLEVAEFLLNRRASIDSPTKDGWTALHIASHDGNVAIVKLLLQRGANVNLQDSKGSSCLFFASQNNYSEIAEILLNEGADVNLKKADGWTALHIACRENHMQTVNCLLKHRPDVALETGSGLTAIQIAEQRNFAEIQRLLRKFQSMNAP